MNNIHVQLGRWVHVSVGQASLELLSSKNQCSQVCEYLFIKLFRDHESAAATAAYA